MRAFREFYAKIESFVDGARPIFESAGESDFLNTDRSIDDAAVRMIAERRRLRADLLTQQRVAEIFRSGDDLPALPERSVQSLNRPLPHAPTLELPPSLQRHVSSEWVHFISDLKQNDHGAFVTLIAEMHRAETMDRALLRQEDLLVSAWNKFMHGSGELVVNGSDLAHPTFTSLAQNVSSVSTPSVATSGPHISPSTVDIAGPKLSILSQKKSFFSPATNAAVNFTGQFIWGALWSIGARLALSPLVKPLDNHVHNKWGIHIDESIYNIGELGASLISEYWLWRMMYPAQKMAFGAFSKKFFPSIQGAILMSQVGITFSKHMGWGMGGEILCGLGTGFLGGAIGSLMPGRWALFLGVSVLSYAGQLGWQSYKKHRHNSSLPFSVSDSQYLLASSLDDLNA